MDNNIPGINQNSVKKYYNNTQSTIVGKNRICIVNCDDIQVAIKNNNEPSNNVIPTNRSKCDVECIDFDDN